MKKNTLSMLCATAMLLTLAGCGADESSSQSNNANDISQPESSNNVSEDSNSSTAETKLAITWWGNQTRNERTQAVLDLYSEQNPGITFDTQPAEWSDYWTKLSTLAAGNALPECLQMDYSYIDQYMNSGLLVDMNPYVESGILDVSNIDESILNACTSDGKLYAVSIGQNAPALLYNKTLMDELNIEVKDGMTLDEFTDIARQVYDKTGIKTDVAYGSSDNFFPYLLRANDTTKLFNNDSLNVENENAFVEFFSLYETGAKEGWILSADVYAELTVASVEQSPLIYYSSPATQSWCAFFWTNQLTAMVAAAPEDMEIGITTWPSNNVQKSNFLKPSGFFCVSRDAGTNEEEAVKVVNYMLNSVDAHKILLAERGIPTSSVIANEILPLLDETTQRITTFISDVVAPNCSTISPAIPDGAKFETNK